mgnify:CR=1 FL=1
MRSGVRVAEGPPCDPSGQLSLRFARCKLTIKVEEFDIGESCTRGRLEFGWERVVLKGAQREGGDAECWRHWLRPYRWSRVRGAGRRAPGWWRGKPELRWKNTRCGSSGSFLPLRWDARLIRRCEESTLSGKW